MAYTEVMQKRIYTNNDQLRAGHAQLAQSMGVDLFITLATNQQMSIEKMKYKTRGFMARLERDILGRNWAKHDRRMDGLFYVEHELSNIHVHGLLTRTYCNRYGLQLAADEIWNDMCGSGSVVLKDIHEVKRCAAYCTKEYLKHGFFARQFFTA